MIEVHMSAICKRVKLPNDAQVLRCPEAMNTLTAIVTRTDERHAVIFWAGCTDRTALDGRRIGCGVLGCFTTIQAAEALGDKRVLVQDGESGLWMVAVIQRGGAACECGARAIYDRDGDGNGPCWMHPDCGKAEVNMGEPTQDAAWEVQP